MNAFFQRNLLHFVAATVNYQQDIRTTTGIRMSKNNTALRYMQVYLDLKDQIAGGDFQRGTQIPTEKELMSHYGISITTLRRAINILCQEGLLTKKQGSGTYVNGIPANTPAVPVAPEKPAVNQRIAVIMPDVSRMAPEGDARHWQLNLRRVDGIYQEGNRTGANIRLFDLSEPFNLEEFDGAIIFRVFELEMEDVFNRLVAPLKRAGKPYVVLSEYNLRFCDKYWVVENLALEFLSAYRYLKEKGMRKLLVIGLNLTPENPRINVLPLVIEPDCCAFLENPRSDTASARTCMKEYLEAHGGLGDIDTIFCLTDLQAVGAMDALLEYGIRIPEDVNLMGCDNITDGLNAPVPLTTFQFSGRSVGRTALEVVLRAINGDYPDGVMITKRCRIVERDSVRTINH